MRPIDRVSNWYLTRGKEDRRRDEDKHDPMVGAHFVLLLIIWPVAYFLAQGK